MTERKKNVICQDTSINKKTSKFYPTAFMSCGGIVFTHGVQMGVQLVGWREKSCLGCISETVGCKMLIIGSDVGWGI